MIRYMPPNGFHGSKVMPYAPPHISRIKDLAICRGLRNHMRKACGVPGGQKCAGYMYGAVMLKGAPASRTMKS